MSVSFFENSKNLYGDRFGYELFCYAGPKGKSTLNCLVHGPFNVSPVVHLYRSETNSGGCPGCELAGRRSSFIKAAEQKFGNNFDYSKFQYISAKTASTITCQIHGDFEQSADKHLASKYGCACCAEQHKGNRSKGSCRTTRRLSASTYEARFKARHGSGFSLDLSGYEGRTVGVVKLCCPAHGTKDFDPHVLLASKYACQQCAITRRNATKTLSYDEFVADANSVHGGLYQYPEANRAGFRNRQSTVDVICPVHGVFPKKALKHLAGQGCFKCTVARLVASGALTGYSTKEFEVNPALASKPAYLYYIKVGDFYKVGITIHLRNRLKSLKNLSGQQPFLVAFQELPLEQAYVLEQEILERYKSARVYRRWSTELFACDVLTAEDLAAWSKPAAIPEPA